MGMNSLLRQALPQGKKKRMVVRTSWLHAGHNYLDKVGHGQKSCCSLSSPKSKSTVLLAYRVFAYDVTA